MYTLDKVEDKIFVLCTEVNDQSWALIRKQGQGTYAEYYSYEEASDQDVVRWAIDELAKTTPG